MRPIERIAAGKDSRLFSTTLASLTLRDIEQHEDALAFRLHRIASRRRGRYSIPRPGAHRPAALATDPPRRAQV